MEHQFLTSYSEDRIRQLARDFAEMQISMSKILVDAPLNFSIADYEEKQAQLISTWGEPVTMSTKDRIGFAIWSELANQDEEVGRIFLEEFVDVYQKKYTQMCRALAKRPQKKQQYLWSAFPIFAEERAYTDTISTRKKVERLADSVPNLLTVPNKGTQSFLKYEFFRGCNKYHRAA